MYKCNCPCDHHPYQDINLHHPKKFPDALSQLISLQLLPPKITTVRLLSCYISFAWFRILNKRNHNTVYSWVWLLLLNITFLRFTHFILQSFCEVPCCIITTVLSFALLMDIWDISHVELLLIKVLWIYLWTYTLICLLTY